MHERQVSASIHRSNSIVVFFGSVRFPYMEKGQNPIFLKEKYGLHNAPEVEAMAHREELKTGKKLSKDPAMRIQRYLDRLEDLVMDPQTKQDKKALAGKGGQNRPRALSLLREMVMDEYVRPNKEKMAKAAAVVEERAAADLGVEAQYGEQQLEQRGEIAVTDVEGSLDQWISYLSDANEPYPMWFRYYAFRNILDLGEYDKDKGEFPKRSAGTIKLFPDIDRGALAYVQEMIDAAKNPEILARIQAAQRQAGTPDDLLITKVKAEAFAKLSFAKQYERGLQEAGEITPELREETRGQWVTYQQGTDPGALWASLQNKGTAWCTKGYGTAKTQLEGGDFHVYYTLDAQGQPTIPRLAILMQGDKIGEIRGVADNEQNVEENLAEIAEQKMKPLPGAEEYIEASRDTKLLKKVYQKTQKGQPLTKNDLDFLYEVKAPIQGFGYQRHPRIAEIRTTRDTAADMLIVFERDENQIARSVDQINESTNAYVGKLEPGIFDRLPEGVEHVYTKFPEGRIRRQSIEIGGKDERELEELLERNGHKIYTYAKSMMANDDFKRSLREPDPKQSDWKKWKLKSPEEAKLIRLRVEDLGFSSGATTDQIFARAEELGLELCPPEVGPQFRLQYKNQPMNECVYVGMKQISVSAVSSSVFGVVRRDDGSWLRDDWSGPTIGWNADGEFVFRLRKHVRQSVSDGGKSLKP